ncbi:hypothetical protein Tco_0533915 [Tanacetum coccineum]
MSMHLPPDPGARQLRGGRECLDKNMERLIRYSFLQSKDDILSRVVAVPLLMLIFIFRVCFVSPCCEPDSGDFTMDVVEDIFDNPIREPRVHVPNVLPTHPTLHLDSDFTLSSDSLGSDLVVSFPSGTRNKIFDPGIFIGVQSKRFLSLDKFSISFIRDPHFPVIDTLLPFSSENEDKVVNPGILAAGEEKSPHLLSHRGFKAFQLISESPMMISGGDILILDVPFLHFYPSEVKSLNYLSFGYKKYLADANLHVHLEEIKVDKTLRFVEEPVEIIDREVKSLKRSRIPIVKVHWNSKRGHEDFIKTKYPHLLVEQAIVGSTK